MRDFARMGDQVLASLNKNNDPMNDNVSFKGTVHWELFDKFGFLIEDGWTHNLVTQVGDQYWGERAAGISSPPAQITGMQLGTGTTPVAKTGGGAAVVTYVTGSAVAIDGSFPTSALNGSSRRIQFKTTWPAATATANSIAEVVLINQSVGTDSGAAASATIARALLSPVVNKGANDSLAVTWSIDLLGA